MSIVSAFTPATFSLAGINKPHAAQSDLLLLLLLCDLLLSLSGRTEIVPCDDAHGDWSSSGAAS